MDSLQVLQKTRIYIEIITKPQFSGDKGKCLVCFGRFLNFDCSWVTILNESKSLLLVLVSKLLLVLMLLVILVLLVLLDSQWYCSVSCSCMYNCHLLTYWQLAACNCTYNIYLFIINIKDTSSDCISAVLKLHLQVSTQIISNLHCSIVILLWVSGNGISYMTLIMKHLILNLHQIAIYTAYSSLRSQFIRTLRKPYILTYQILVEIRKGHHNWLND